MQEHMREVAHSSNISPTHIHIYAYKKDYKNKYLCNLCKCCGILYSTILLLSVYYKAMVIPFNFNN